MPKTHKFTLEQAAEIEGLLQKTTDTLLYKKLQVLQLRMEGYRNTEIAKITGYSKSRVSALVCIYAGSGAEYFKAEQRVGGNRRNLSFEEEAQLLDTFAQQAEQGNIITVADIKSSYDEACGHESGSGTIYQVLARHDWRKIMPRSKHPKKASKDAIEASKKLTKPVENL